MVSGYCGHIVLRTGVVSLDHNLNLDFRLGNHVHGEFSMAVIQANSLLEHQSQIESGRLSQLNSGPYGAFIGVYDGHGGPEASRFVNDHLFSNVKKYASEHRERSANVIKKAFSATEEDFLSLVKKQWLSKPQIASVGSCCLVGIICHGMMYLANAGDSRVVLGRAERRGLREVTAIQLLTEHNASYESIRQSIRQKLRLLHPNDSQIVVQRHKVWRVKGIIQVSRSIGDAYLKKAEFNREPLLEAPYTSFLKQGIARRLVKAALQIAAKKREMRYSDLKKIGRGVRRHFHDDITVVVLFLDLLLINGSSSPRGSPLSIRGGGVPIAADS